MKTSSYLLCVLGIGLIGIGFYFVILRPPLLPEDIRFMKLDQTQSEVVGLFAAKWLGKVFQVMGGFIASVGLLYFFLALNAFRRFETWAWYVTLFTGALSIANMSVVNFELSSDFRWWILAIVALWVCALVLNSTEKRQQSLLK